MGREPRQALVGVYARGEDPALRETLKSLRVDVATPAEVLVLEDEPSPPAAFNRLLAHASPADRAVVFLESGALVTPGWLDEFLHVLEMDAGHGLAGPSTNLAWNVQRRAAAPSAKAPLQAIRRFAERCSETDEARYQDLGGGGPADFCLAVKRQVVEAVGQADTSSGRGPCWQQAYAARAARAGFRSVWAPCAYVHRRPLQEKRRTADAGPPQAPRREARPVPARPKPPPRDQPVRVEDSPRVSCIMPTNAARCHFVPQAVRYFLRQDYPNRELIVVDDDGSVGDLLPPDPRIRHLSLGGPAPLGTKRNRACEAAAGEIIVHWDDDDWMAPWRIRYQVEQLRGRSADICGLARLLFYDPAGHRCWEYVYPPKGKPWVAGGTCCYKRDVWRRRPFPPLQVGEDTRFVWQAPGARILALDDTSFYVGLIHDGNTSRKRTADRRWHARPLARVEDLLGQDLGFYHGGHRPSAPRRAGRHEESRATSRETEDRVTVSIPYFRARKTLRQAVSSILEQTCPHLRVVVLNDADEPPWDLLDDLDDPRLVRFDLEANRGRYFADAVLLGATPDPYFLVQDADDWSEPSRVAVLLQALRDQEADAALSGCVWHDGSNEDAVTRRAPAYLTKGRGVTERFVHIFSHHSLFRADALRRLGGNYGGFRISYDTLIVNLLAMTSKVAHTDEVLYHRRICPGSLTRSKATGFGSATRRLTEARLRRLHTAAFNLFSRFRSGHLAHDAMTAQIRALVTRQIRAADQRALRRETARLREVLDRQDGRVRDKGA